MGKKCKFSGCKSDSRYFYKDYMLGVLFFPFPKPQKNLSKCKEWLAACGRTNTETVTRDWYVCSRHFIDLNGPTEEYPNPIQRVSLSEPLSNTSNKHSQYYRRNREIIKNKRAAYYKKCKSQIQKRNTSYCLQNKSKANKYKLKYWNRKKYSNHNRILTSKKINPSRYRQLALVKNLLRSYKSNIAQQSRLTNIQFVKTQIKAQLLARKAIHTKNVLYAKSLSASEKFSNKCKQMLSKSTQNITAKNLCEIIGGERIHNSNAEPYFWEIAYHPLVHIHLDHNYSSHSNSKIERIPLGDLHFEKNIDGHHPKTLMWKCGPLCNIRENSVQRLLHILHIFASSQGSSTKELFSNIDCCEYKSYYIKEDQMCAVKLGHPVHCLDNCKCKSILRVMTELSPHYSGLRTLLRHVYGIKKLFDAYNLIDRAILNADFIDLKVVVEELGGLIKKEKKKDNCETNSNTSVIRPIWKEAELLEQFEKPLAYCFREMHEFHDTPCDSCEKLYQKRKLTPVSKLVSKHDLENTQNIAFNILRTAWLLQKPGSDIELFEELNLCDYCYKRIISGKVPERSFLNGLEVHPIPDEIKNLNMFEKILIQKCKAFQVVVRLGTKLKTLNHSGLTKAIKGKIIYLHLPLQNNIDMIPQGLPDNHELHILVNGQPTKNKIVWQSIVRLEKIMKALRKLKEINPLYADIHISQCNTDYICGNCSEIDNRISTQPDALLYRLSETQQKMLVDQYTIHPVNGKNPTGILDAFQMKKVEKEAVSLFEKNLDLMCFPDLFPTGEGGRYSNRPFGDLTEADYRATRILNKDRRFSLNEQYLFHCFYESEIKSMTNSINFMLRMTGNKRMPVNSLIDKFVAKDSELEAALSAFMQNMRGTQEYWYKRQGELKTMMQNFGSPTWFVTLSCAEYDWFELHEHLRLSYSDKIAPNSIAELCSSDPVAVSLHYHNRFQALWKHLIMNKENAILGKVEHYFWRVEYQGRGTPHIHMVLWIKDAPKIGNASDKEILAFIQKYVTCSLPDKIESPNLNEYVQKYQMHRCNPTCQRKYKSGDKFLTRCRFKFPRATATVAKLNDVHSSIRHHLSSKSKKRLYILPRTSAEMYINDYNPLLLYIWKANVDVQFIADKEIAVARYITSYITKKEKSDMEDLWNELANKDLRSRLFSFGLKAISHRECGAYEVADRILGHHLYGKSESILFINTTKKEKRKRLLKPFKELNKLKETDPTSEAIFMVQMVDDVYPNRPDELENISLYDFSAFYYRVPQKSNEKMPNNLQLKNNIGLLKKRCKPFLIQHTRHDPDKSDTERENYYHSLLMLFLPWRDESMLLGDHVNYQKSFENHLPKLKQMMEYHDRLKVLKEGEKKLEESLEKSTQSDYENVIVQDDMQNALQGHEIIEAGNAMAEVTAAMIQNLVPYSTNLATQVSQLHADQKKIFDTVQKHFSSKSESSKPLTMFVSGCGGTGKSFLIHVIKNMISKFFNNSFTNAVAAPTGLAALNIGGVTLHRLLMLPVEHGKTAEYHKLGVNSLAIMQKTLTHLKLLIVDEISMVSSLILSYIHLRLVEITGKDELFGGISVLFFGDLLQLQPVKGNPPYSKLTHTEARKLIGSVGAINIWKEYFLYDELTLNKRQKNDLVYAELLNRVRVGEVTPDDIKILETRLIPNTDNIENVADYYFDLMNQNLNPVCLLPTNKLCLEINSVMLQKAEKNVIEIHAEDTISGFQEMPRTVKTQLEKLKQKSSDTAGLESVILICEGCRIMLRRNLSIEKGLVNGSMGTVKGFKKDSSGKIISICILFDNHATEKYIERVNVKFEIMKNVYVKRSQFPIVLSYGITIHKSQGMSLNCVMINLGPNIFESGMSYVALSRVTSLEGLHLLKFDASKVYASPNAIKEYNRLRKEYRSDLPQLAVCPRKYSESKMVVSSDISVIVSEKNNKNRITDLNYFVFKGFKNTDRSCYANAMLQTLFCIPEFVKKIQERVIDPGPTTKALKKMFTTLQNPQIETVDTLEVRKTLHVKFHDGTDQDPLEFLDYLLENLSKENINAIDLFQLKQDLWEKCSNCPSYRDICISTEPFNAFIVRFPHDFNNREDAVDFNDLLTRWQTENIACVHCKNRTKMCQTRLNSCGKYLFVQLARFSSTNVSMGPNRTFKITCPITGFSNQKVLINNITFKTKSAILHKGKFIDSGHYITMVHSNENEINKWTVCDDMKITERARFVNNLADVYILLLQKC